ncbi:MAG TPA: MarR family transcriptional regulator [Actinopolymorphaceae bacterium]
MAGRQRAPDKVTNKAPQPRRFPTADPEAAASERLHAALMELIRVTGLLQPDQIVPDGSLSLSQAFAIHELDVDPPLTQRDLVERLRLDKSSVSRLVADLERKALVVRERDPANRRYYRLTLTRKGRAAHTRIAKDFHRHYVRWVTGMTPAEVDALLVGLPALIRAIRREQADSPTPHS